MPVFFSYISFQGKLEKGLNNTSKFRGISYPTSGEEMEPLGEEESVTRQHEGPPRAVLWAGFVDRHLRRA
jgi:hypothetical protein